MGSKVIESKELKGESRWVLNAFSDNILTSWDGNSEFDGLVRAYHERLTQDGGMTMATNFSRLHVLLMTLKSHGASSRSNAVSLIQAQEGLS